MIDGEIWNPRGGQEGTTRGLQCSAGLRYPQRGGHSFARNK